MSLNWMTLAMGSATSIAVVNIFDSHFVSVRLPSPRMYFMMVGAFVLLVGLAFWYIFPFSATQTAPVLTAAASGALRATSILIFLSVMKKEEVGRVIPVLATSPAFVAIFALFFLGERIAAPQWAAVGLVVGGAVLISLKRGDNRLGRRLGPVFFLLLGASMLTALADVTGKQAMGSLSHWQFFYVTILVISIFLLATSLRKDTFAELRLMHSPAVDALLVVAVQSLSMLGMILGFRAVQLGPVSLVSTVSGSRPLIVFALSLGVSLVAPGFIINEKNARGGLALKLLATVLVVAGVSLVYLV